MLRTRTLRTISPFVGMLFKPSCFIVFIRGMLKNRFRLPLSFKTDRTFQDTPNLQESKFRIYKIIETTVPSFCLQMDSYSSVSFNRSTKARLQSSFLKGRCLTVHSSQVSPTVDFNERVSRFEGE